MNKNVQLWVEALRSGDYEQGEGALTKEGKHCCLGVACVLYQEKVGGLVETDSTSWTSGAVTSYDGESGFLPRKVSDWLGLAERNGRYDNGDLRTSLSSSNDNGFTFEEIATMIEKKPEGLFK